MLRMKMRVVSYVPCLRLQLELEEFQKPQCGRQLLSEIDRCADEHRDVGCVGGVGDLLLLLLPLSMSLSLACGSSRLARHRQELQGSLQGLQRWRRTHGPTHVRCSRNLAALAAPAARPS